MKNLYQTDEKFIDVEGRRFTVVHKVPVLSPEEYDSIKQEAAKKLYDIFLRSTLSANSEQK